LKAGAENTKTLLIWPPTASLYDNLCYHYCAFGEVAGYLDRLTRLEVVDAAVASCSLNDVALRILAFRPDFVVFYHDFDILPSVQPLVTLIRAVSDARIFTYGPPGMYTQKPFLEMGIDGVVYDGDWEYALGSCLEEPDCPRGVVTRSSQLEGWRLPSSEWGFPPLEKLPVEHYKAWGRVLKPNSERAGLMGLSEFSLTLTRGCGRRCRFCKTPAVEGPEHRKRDLAAAADFIAGAVGRYGFDYFSVYSPNFTMDRDYAAGFALEMKRRGIAWKCVTSLDFLDPDILEIMAEGGCRRIGVGAETFSRAAAENLQLRKNLRPIEEIASICRKAGVDLHCFLMLGIPGEERTAFVEGVRSLIGAGASVRITSYVPLQDISRDSSWNDLVRMNRKTYCCSLPAGMSRREFSEIIFDQDRWIRNIL
jgi:anaerobic magnesium-protoporphyrin IX monomethyl ester cyclase